MTTPDALAAVAACPIEHIRQGLAAFAISGANPGGMVCDRCAAIAIAAAEERGYQRAMKQVNGEAWEEMNTLAAERARGKALRRIQTANVYPYSHPQREQSL